MASGFGNLFSSLGESADRRQMIQREDAQRAQDKAERDRQFNFMMQQFLTDKADREGQRKLQLAGIASQNMVPDAPGSAGSLDMNDPRLAAIKGTPYDRSSEGMTLPSKTTQFGPDGAPTGQTASAPKPTGKFVWNPSWEQQQQVQQTQLAQQGVTDARNFQREQTASSQGFQRSQQDDAQKFQATQQANMLNSEMARLKESMGAKMTPQQTIAMQTLNVLLAHQPKPGLDGTIDPVEWQNWMNIAQGPMTTLGIGGGPEAMGGDDPNDPLHLNGGGGPVMPQGPTESPRPTPQQFLDPNAPRPNTTQQQPPLTWDSINERMNKVMPNSGNWNPFTFRR